MSSSSGSGTADMSNAPLEEPLPQAIDPAVKDLYATLIATRNLEVNLFWQRSNYFLALNSAIALGFFNLKDSRYVLLFAVVALATSVLWFRVCLGSKYWQTRWEQRLMDFENHHFPGLAFFAADRDRIQADVRRGLEFHPAKGIKRWIYRKAMDWRPSVSYSMITLSGLFAVVWSIAVLLSLIDMA